MKTFDNAPRVSSPPTTERTSQWFAWWAGVHAAAQSWANKKPMAVCPYPMPDPVSERHYGSTAHEPINLKEH